MKSAEEIMNMLEAFDLTGSLRDAGELAGVSHHTVGKYVTARQAGALADRPTARAQLMSPTTSWSRWGTPGRGARPGGRSPPSRRTTAWAGCGCTGRG